MRLLINTSSAAQGGSVQVAISFLRECCSFSEHSYGVIVGPGLAGLLKVDEFPVNFKFYFVNERPSQRLFAAVRGHIFSHIEKDFSPDCVFTTSGPSYWKSGCPHLIGYNLPHYVYRDSPYFKIISRFERIAWWARGMVIRYFYRRDANALVVQTDDVNERARKYLGIEDVLTVSNTCGAQYFKTTPHVDFLPERVEGEVRLLCLSAYYDHKNLGIINSIISELKKIGIYSVRFVLTMRDDELENNFNTKSRSMIYNVGRLSPLNAPHLYEEVDCMFLPTLLECFSASYAEAMAMKVPILTSDLSFARTVCGDAALYFDPLDPVCIAKKIGALIRSKAMRQELISAGQVRVTQFNSAQQRALAYLAKCMSLSGEK